MDDKKHAETVLDDKELDELKDYYTNPLNNPKLNPNKDKEV